MATVVRHLKIQVDQTGDAKTGFGDLSGILAGIGGAAVAGAAISGLSSIGSAILDLGGDMVNLGADAEEMEAKFNVVFGESAAEAVAQLDKFGDAVGRNKFDLMEMAASVQDTFVPMGFARDQAAELSLGLTELAVDVGSFNNQLETDVMRDFQSALVGNHETVRKYGIVITENILSQELMNMGIEGGTKAATEAEKVQARLNLLYQGTTDAQGDAARTSDSWTNSMRALKAELAEAQTTIGSELLPVLTPFLQIGKDIVGAVLPVMIDLFSQLAGFLTANVVPIIEELWNWFSTKLVPVFQEFFSEISEALQPALEDLFEAFGEIFEALGIGTGEVDALDIALVGLKATLDLVVAIVNVLSPIISGMANSIKALAGVIDDVVDKWDDFKDAVRDAVDAIPDWLIPGSPTPFEEGLRGIGAAISNLPDLNFGTGAGLSGAGGVNSININLTYAPAVSLGDRYEAEHVIAPLITGAVRRELSVRGAI